MNINHPIVAKITPSGDKHIVEIFGKLKVKPTSLKGLTQFSYDIVQSYIDKDEDLNRVRLFHGIVQSSDQKTEKIYKYTTNVQSIDSLTVLPVSKPGNRFKRFISKYLLEKSIKCDIPFSSDEIITPELDQSSRYDVGTTSSNFVESIVLDGISRLNGVNNPDDNMSSLISNKNIQENDVRKIETDIKVSENYLQDITMGVSDLNKTNNYISHSNDNCAVCLDSHYDNKYVKPSGNHEVLELSNKMTSVENCDITESVKAVKMDWKIQYDEVIKFNNKLLINQGVTNKTHYVSWDWSSPIVFIRKRKQNKH